MLNMEICPCGECKISNWCISEQVKFQDHDQERRGKTFACGVVNHEKDTNSNHDGSRGKI